MSDRVFYIKELNSDSSVYFYGPFPDIDAAGEYIDYLARNYQGKLGNLSVTSWGK